jgi:hypothetical protein
MKIHRNSRQKWLPLGLCFVLACDVIPQPAAAQNPPKTLNIVVVTGEGTVNNIRQRVTQDPEIRVEDENNKPVVGAAVVFTLPVSGATGEFSNGSKNLTVVTGPDGVAAARGIKSNETAGKLQIHVNVSFRGLTARTLITQFNMAVPGAKSGGGGGKIIAILAVIGAAAAGGAVAATRKNSNSNSPVAVVTPPPAAPSPIGINPGTGTISPPR